MSRKLSLTYIKKVARERGGKCLSNSYINNKAALRWRCKAGHEWSARVDAMLRGAWCKICSYKETGLARRTSINDIRDLAKSRRGKCLSAVYEGSGKRITWQCEKGHKWDAILSSVKGGKWCPYCKTNISEEVCRALFVRFFEVPFPRVKPSWLISETGTRLELDGYSDELKLAFEYQGVQHYVHNRFMSKGQQALDIRRKTDKLKRCLCSANGVRLVVVPYTVNFDEMGVFIKRECKGLKLKNPTVRIDSPFDALPKTLDTAIAIAGARGGKCLSKVYFHNKMHLKWQCKKGHEWDATFNNVVSKNSWCRICAGYGKKDISHMQKIAKDKSGKCLSVRYMGVTSKLKWQCGRGHVWQATYDSIRKGSWCRICAFL